jgi:choline dehydrogenase-like flavoprotein
MIVIAEDQPLASNRVTINRSKRDRFGLPEFRINHRYSGRDRAARRALVRESKRILKEAGARMTLTKAIKTFSHALGTLRMGEDPDTSPVDEKGRFRGIDNLYIADGSVFPTSGGVNPSLTIAANALRVASGLLK